MTARRSVESRLRVRLEALQVPSERGWRFLQRLQHGDGCPQRGDIPAIVEVVVVKLGAEEVLGLVIFLVHGVPQLALTQHVHVAQPTSEQRVNNSTCCELPGARSLLGWAESQLAHVQPNPTETRAPNAIARVDLADPSSCRQHSRVLVGLLGLPLPLRCSRCEQRENAGAGLEISALHAQHLTQHLAHTQGLELYPAAPCNARRRGSAPREPFPPQRAIRSRRRVFWGLYRKGT